MYEYIIKIEFIKSRPECAIGKRISNYPYSNGKTDIFTFNKASLKIEAVRSTLYKDGEILSSNRKTFYGQILKGLLVYYGLAHDFPQVKSVKIIRKRKRLPDIVYTEAETFLQPLDVDVNTPRFYYLDVSKIDSILEETPKGNTIRIALTYWLKAISMSTNNYYNKFDRLWRSYDRLLLYQGDTTQERIGIPAIKELISQNHILFQKSIAITNSYTVETLRSFSWIKLLYSKTNKFKKVDELARRVTEYKDNRINVLFQEIVSSRKITKILSEAGKLADVQQHFIDNKNTKKDIDIVLLMSLSYAYYMRCKYFHGEVPDSTFKLQQTNEDIEILRLTELLESVVYELLNNNNIFR